MLRTRILAVRRLILAVLSVGLVAAFLFAFMPPPSQALVAKTDGLHLSRSGFGTYYGCTTTDCADSDTQIKNSINSATTNLGTRTVIDFVNDNADKSEGVALNSDNFHLVYRGYFFAPTTRTYYFGTESDDMSYVWLGSSSVNDPTYSSAIVKNQGLHGLKYASGSVSLEGNRWHPIMVLFGERAGGAAVRFYWSTSDISSQPSSPSQLTATNFRHSGNTFFTSPVPNPSNPVTATDPNTSLVTPGSYVTNKSTISFTGTTVGNSKVEYSWSTSSSNYVVAGQCSVSSTNYTCTISGYTGDTRYIRVRAYDDYSNVSGWSAATKLEGKVLQSLTNIENPILNRPLSIQPQVQLRFASANQTTSGVSVTASISSGATLSGTTTVTTVNGVATFTDLQVTGGTPGTNYTITFASDGYLSATDSFTLRTLPTQITISTNSSTNGGFENGVWYANTATASVINSSALTTELAARNVTLEAQYTSSSSTLWSDGTILFRGDVNIATPAERTITFRASKNIYFDQSPSLSSTNGKLNVVLWADTDSISAGSVRVAAGANAAISTNGGHLAIGGGSSSTLWNGLTIPSGRAAGNTQYTGARWGVELYASTGPLVSTAGGDVRILGTSRNPAGYNVDLLYGVYWDRGQIATGSGSLSIEGVTGSDPSVSTNPNYGVVVGANASSSLKASYLGTGGLSIVGSTATTSSDHRGVSVRYADLDAGSSTVTISSDRRVQLLDDVSVKSRFEVTSNQNVFINGAQSWTGSSGGKSAVLTSTVGSINIGAPITSTSGLDFVCNSGTFTNTSAGTITAGANLDVSCSTVTVGGVISASGNVQLESQGTSSVTSVNANLISDTAGGSILVKSKSNIITANSVLIQTEGKAAGVGGDIVLWSDSDASGQGFIRTGANVTMNSIGGSESSTTGGGDIHLAGGDDDGATSISALAVEGDGLPDGWAISTSADFGVEIGSGANVNTVNKFFSGGGDLRIFAKTTTASDAMAFNWATIADSGLGQVEFVADAIQWGIQINRNGEGNFATKSQFISRSNLSPAISMRATTIGSANIALLGSWDDSGRDNLTIQSVGDGSIELLGSAPNSSLAGVGFTSTSILSKSGLIKIDGDTRGIHLGMLNSGHTQGQVQLGECAVGTCPNSLVPTSTANVELIGNRVTSHGSLSTTVDTSGTLTVVPALGSTAFRDFPSRAQGLTLSSDLGGLTFGRADDQTAMDLTGFSASISGPITINSDYIRVRGNLTTTGAGSDIRLLAKRNIYTETGVNITTNGGDVVMWTNTDKVAGVTQDQGSIYLDPVTITTSGGKIWLAGGRDDGGVDAGITTEKGKWSSVVAGDGLPDGYAMGDGADSWWSTGVLINRNSVLNSGGGDIYIAGAQGIGTSWSTGHVLVFAGSKIDSGSGRIAMWGKSHGGSSSQGVALNYDGTTTDEPTMITSNAPSADAISIYSDSSAGNAWSRGIVAAWFSKESATRSFQGTQIVATAPQGGITLTGIGATSGDGSANGLYLDFVDILAQGGPITLNGSGPSAGSAGVTLGWHNNVSNDIRIGAWTAGNSGAVGGGVITSPSGVQYDMTSSTSDITINTDSIWTRESGVRGTLIATSGDFKVLPTSQLGGVFADTDNFKTTQNTTDFSYSNLFFTVTPETITLGRPTTTTATTVKSDLKAHGAISVFGSALNFQNSVINESGRGPVLLKSTSSIALAASRIYQTNGSDLVFWASSGGGNGSISVGNAACINSNSSCDPEVSVATGNINMGGGAAGTSTPTGPVISNTSSNAISFGTSQPSDIRVLSGGGNVSLQGTSSGSHGVSSFSGLQVRAATGAISIVGSSGAASRQGVRIALAGTSTIASGKVSGDAITIIGSNSSGSTANESSGLGIGHSATEVNIFATGGGDIKLQGTVSANTVSTFIHNAQITASSGGVEIDSLGGSVSLNSDITAGADGILVKSAGRITSNEGTSSSYRTFSTAGGPITFWTTGITGGVSLDNFTRIDTTQSGSDGADITIGGGSDDGNGRPSGAAASSGANAIQLGNSNVANGVVMRAGTGVLSVSGSSTSASAFSGVRILSGLDIEAARVRIDGSSGYNATSGPAASGVSSYNQSSAPILIHATGTFSTPTDAIEITSSSDSQFGLLLGPNSANVTDSVTLRASGDEAGIAISGTSTINSEGAWLAGIVLETKNGLTTIDSGNGSLSLGRDSGRPLAFRPVSQTQGGDLIVRGARQGSTPALTIETSGQVSFVPTGTSFDADVTFPNAGSTVSVGSLEVGSATNTRGLTVGAAVTATGNITYLGGSFAQATGGTLTSTGEDSVVRIVADTATITHNLTSAAGVVALEPRTTGRGIQVGGTSSTTLHLTAAQLQTFISAETLRLGDRQTTGDVLISANIDLTGKVQNLAIRSSGNVTSGTNVAVVVANLGIDAGGNISWPGASHNSAVIALNAGSSGSISFGQSADYSVAAVDGIDPEFGFGVKFAISNVPVDEPLDAFMAVTFNPPPAVTILDKFNNVLAANNLSAADFAVTPTLTVVSSTGTPILAGATPNRSGGTFTFGSLNVAEATGEVTITFAANRSGTALAENSSFDNGGAFTVQASPTFTTASYNIQAGEPDSIAITIASTSAQAGKVGFGITATLKDTGNNTIASGSHAEKAITVSIAGADGAIVSGNTPATVAGVANFSDLVIGGKVATNYTLTFSVTFTDTQNVVQTRTQTQVVTLAPGDATKLGVSPATQTQATGQVLSDVTVSVLDEYDNLVTSSNAQISIAMSAGSNGGSAAFVGYSTPVAASSGQVVFNTLGINGTAGDYTLTFSTGSLTAATHVATMTHSVAHRIDLVMPTTAKNDVVLTTQPVVTVYDVYDNVVLDFTGSVALTVDSGSLGGTLSMPAVAGVADFADLGVKLIGVSGDKTVTATAASISRTDTAPVTLSFGPAVALELAPAAAGFVNRVDFATQPNVKVVDSSRNTVENFAGDITVAVSGSNIALDGTTTISLVDADNGVKGFSGLSLRGAVASYTLTYSSGTLTVATQTAPLTHGAAFKLTLSAPTDAANDTVFGSQPIVSILDEDNNSVISGLQSTQVVTLSATGATLAGVDAQALAMPAVAGIANFTGKGLKLTGTAGPITLTAAITDPSAISRDETITLGFGAATKLAITTEAQGFVNRTNFSVQPKVTVQDVSGNTVTNFDGNVELEIGANASITGTRALTLTAAELGVANFEGLGLQGIAGSYTITAKSAGLADATQSITLEHGAAFKLTVSAPGSAANDTVFGSQPIVSILDEDNNSVISGPESTQVVTLSATGATLSGVDAGALSMDAVAGVANFSGKNLKLTGTAGAITLTAAITDPSAISRDETITLGFGTATKLAITTEAVGFVNRTNFSTQPIITVQDVSGNTVQNYAGTISLAIGSGASITGTTAITLVSPNNGVANFAGLGLEGTAGNYTITAKSDGLADSTQSITLEHGVATRVELTAPATITNNTLFSPQPSVRILDQDGNLVDTGLDAVHNLTLTSNATLAGTATITTANGVATFSGLKLTGTLGSKTLSVTSSSVSAISGTANTTIQFGAAAKLAITTPAAGFVNRTNFSVQPKITVQDVSGNTVTNFAGNVELQIGANASITGTRTLTLTAAELGVANFAGLGLEGTAGSYTITASSGALSVATQDLTLTHGAATKVVIVQTATGTRSGQLFDTPIQLQVQDADSNVTNTGDGATAQITVTKTQGNYGSGGADFGGTFSVGAIGGAATFSDLTLSGVAGDYDLSFAVSEPGVLTGFAPATQTINLLAGSKNSIAVVQQPTNAQAGVAFSPVVTVQVLDAWSNRILADSTSVVTAERVSPDNATNFGTVATATAASGIATFSGMQINKIDEFKLRFTSNSVATVLSDNFTVAHGPASKLAFVLNPVIARSDVAFTTQLRLLDEFDNAVTTGPQFTVTSSVVSANSANVQALTGNQAVSSEGTEVLFFSSKLKAPVASYQLRYTATDGTNTFFIDSNNIALGFGLPSQLNIATPAATARAGEVLGTLPVVEIQDSAGNLVADSTLRVTASVAGKALVGTAFVDAVGGVANFSATGLGIAGTVADALSLQFAIESPASSFITETQSIDLVAGPARYLHILQEPTEFVTRETFSPAVAVQLRDQYQNPVLSDSTTSVSALLYGANNEVATATAGEPAITAISQQAVAGVVDFSALSFAVPPASGYYLKFALPSDLDVVNSAAFKVVPGAVASIVIDQQPSTTNQDNSLVKTGELLAQMPQVSLYDQDGYLADNAVGSVTLSIASGAGGDLSEGSTSATIAAGHADFVGVKLVGKPAQGATPAEQYTLQVSFAGVNSPATNALVVTHNVAHKLALQREAANGRAGEAFSQQPIVEIQDRYDNLVESSNAAIRVGPSAGGSVTGREVNAQAGLARFTNLALGGLTTNTYSLTYEIPNTTVATVQQTGVTLSYGFADRLLLTTAPVSLDGNGELTKTGDPLFGQPVIKVFDAHNNIVENSNDIITATFVSIIDERDRLENAVFQAVNGVASFQDLKLIARPSQDYRLSFGSGTLSNAQSGVLGVRHADAHAIEIVTEPSAVIDAVNGVLTRTGNNLHIQPQIKILDFDGNHADSAAGVNVVATVSSGDGAAVTANDTNGRPFNEAVISGGLASFSELKLVAIPGVPQELSFSAAFATGAVVSVATAPVTLTNGLARALAMHVEPCAGVDDGTSCAAGVTGAELLTQPVVKVLDEFGNVVVDHVGDVVVSVSAAGAMLAVTDSDDVSLRTVSVLAGFASFDLLELTANPGQPVKLNFASAELTGVSSRDLVVAAGGAARLEMVVNPVGERTGNELSTQPKVKLVDRFGNTVLSDSTTQVTVTASGGNLFTEPDAPLVVTADQGEVSFAGLRFTGTPGADFTLEFTAAGVTPVVSSTFRVTNAFADDLVITQQPVAGKTGDLLTQMPILELKDFDGNLAEDDNETVVTASIDVSNGAAVLVDAQDQPLVAAPSFTADNGVIRFAGIRIVATPGTVYKLNFTATPEAGDPFSSPASEELVFAHANPAQLVMTQSAVGGLAGADLTTQPELEIRDRFGNKATGDSATILTAVIETGASGDVLRGATATAINGEVRFAGLALDGVPAQTYTLGFDAVSQFGASFRVVDAVELTLSRPATLTLSMAQVAYVPDMVVTPVFTTDSAGVVTWSTSSDPGICVLELDGSNNLTGNVIVKGVGTCSLRAEVARFDLTHTAAPQSSYLPSEVSANLVITKAQQATLTMSSADNVDFRGSLNLGSTGGSSTGDVRYFVTGDCRVIGGVLLPGQAGALCEVFARKAGDANYESVDSDEQVVTTNRVAQSTLRIANGRNVAVGDIELFTSGGTDSGSEIGAVTYQVSTPGSALCQIIDGNILRATQNGSCGVMATKQPTTNYLIAISPQVTFTFSKMSQTVDFNFAVPARPTPGTLFEPTAVASSGLDVNIAISAGEGVVCEFDSIQTTRIRFLTSGSCILTATQAGSSQFTAAFATLTISADKLNQSITFNSILDRKFGDPKFQLDATASSSLPVSYSVGTTYQSPACSVNASGMVTLTDAGMCEVVATQAGNGTYSAAPNVTRMFSVAPDLAGAPHLVSVSVSNQAITAKFRAPSYLGGSQVSAFRLEATDGAGDTYLNPGCLASGADLVCDLVGMPLNVAYTVRVAAVTAAGIGNYSESSMPVTPGSTEIAVMKLSADQVSGQLEVTWKQPLALDSNFVSYDIFVWPVNTDIPQAPTDSISSLATESVSYVMTEQTVSVASFSALSQLISIPMANSYNIKVVTITDSSYSALTDVNVASGMQLGLGVPGRPRNEIIDADGQQLRVAWSEPNSDGGAEVTHYMIRKAGDDAPACGLVNHGNAPLAGLIDDDWNYSLNDAAALLYQQQDLAAGSSYEIAIFACNEIGASVPAILTHSIPAPPAPQAPPAPAVPEVEEVPKTEEVPEEREDEVVPAPAAKPDVAQGPKPTPSPSEILQPEAPATPGAEVTEEIAPETTPTQVPMEPEPEDIETESAAPPASSDGGGIDLLWILAVIVLVMSLARFAKVQLDRRNSG